MHPMQTANLPFLWRRLGRVAVLMCLTVALLLGLVSVLVVLEGRRDDLRQATVSRVGAAIVLGAALVDGAPSPAFQARLDHALDLYRRGQVRQIIVTGGPSASSSISEAAAARTYLLGRGLPPEVLLAEETSTSTLQNVQHSAPLIAANNIQSVVLVSEPTHMLRALKMARDLGITAYSSPSPGSERLLDTAGSVIVEAVKYFAYLFFAW